MRTFIIYCQSHTPGLALSEIKQVISRSLKSFDVIKFECCLWQSVDFAVSRRTAVANGMRVEFVLNVSIDI